MRRRQRRQPGSNALTGDDLDDAKAVVSYGGSSRNEDVYGPQPAQRIPKSGAWAMVVRAIGPIEGALHEHLRVGRVFHVEHMAGADDDGFLPDGRYKVQTHSPWGTCCLWPYEYSVVEPVTLTELWQDGELVFHPTNVEQARFNNVVFYARSRGIDLADAAVMALGTFSGSVGWFEPRPDLAATMEAMSARVHEWPWSTRRRAAARRKRA